MKRFWPLRDRAIASPETGDAELPLRPARGAMPEKLRNLAHGEAIPDDLQAWIEDEVATQAVAAGSLAAPTIGVRDLTAHVEGMPGWWQAGGNVMLVGPDAVPVVPELSLLQQHPTNALAILGSRARVHRLVYMGDRGLIVVGENVNFWAITLGVVGSATIMIGDKATATFDGSLDARNGGSIHVGADGMWGAGIRIITDDMHAIRDRDTGVRVNGRGGRIAIEPHVWLAEKVQIVGNCRIGEGSVIGVGSLVAGRDLPPHSVCVGRPARPVRSNIIWSREDAP